MKEQDIVDEFSKDMVDALKQAKEEYGYNATRCMQLLSEIGAVATAKRLILDPNLKSGFEKMWELNRLDLTIEYLVLKPQYQMLFTDEERDICKNKLEELNFNV